MDPVNNEKKKQIQKVTGKFLWYGRGVDGTILTPLSAIAAKQSKPTVNTMKQGKQIMDYLAMQEPAVLTYRKSHMVLQSTVMPATLMKKKPKAEPEATTASLRMYLSPPTKAQFTTFPKS